MENYLFKKLRIKRGCKISIVNPPENYLNSLQAKGEDIEVSTKLGRGIDLIQLFIKSRTELNQRLPPCIKSLKDNGILWISYPKKSSMIKSDLSRDKGWDILKELNYRPVSLISIDETWSALRLKPVEKVNVKKEISNEYIDREKRTIKLPDDLKKELDKNIKAKNSFDKLSFTHKKEYVSWILESKKAETRSRRIKLVVKRIGGQKIS